LATRFTVKIRNNPVCNLKRIYFRFVGSHLEFSILNWFIFGEDGEWGQLQSGKFGGNTAYIHSIIKCAANIWQTSSQNFERSIQILQWNYSKKNEVLLTSITHM